MQYTPNAVGKCPHGHDIVCPSEYGQSNETVRWNKVKTGRSHNGQWHCKKCEHLAWIRYEEKRHIYRKHLLYSPRPHKKRTLERAIFLRAAHRAKQKGLSFTITFEDVVIPERCPVLGILLRRTFGKGESSSPSLDRIDNALGYDKGNVRVISHRANTLKRDSTDDELIMLALDAMLRKSPANINLFVEAVTKNCSNVKTIPPKKINELLNASNQRREK